MRIFSVIRGGSGGGVGVSEDSVDPVIGELGPVSGPSVSSISMGSSEVREAVPLGREEAATVADDVPFARIPPVRIEVSASMASA